MISCMLAPAANYLKYIDPRTICLLFCLMLTVAGFRQSGLLTALSQRLLGGRGCSARRTGFALVFLSFFSAPFFTNDVALLAFVPLTAMLFGKRMIYVTVLQTAAANLGSILTPFGNPQNLYLYGRYAMSPGEFFSATVPVFISGGALLFLLCLAIKREPLHVQVQGSAVTAPKSHIAVYVLMFVICLLAVFGAVNIAAAMILVCGAALAIRPRLLAGVDYGLLITFAFFFIFVGNLREMETVREWISELVNGREMLASAAVSQVISNVPAAVMLSEFAENPRAVVLGTNIGGLGTIVASLASVISFRIYMETEGARPLKYLGVFTALNAVLLVIIYIFADCFLI